MKAYSVIIILVNDFFYCFIAESQDMDISPGDSTPTSEASYSHSSTPTTHIPSTVDGPVLLANALPRLTSHPAAASSSSTTTPINLQNLHFNTPTSSTSGFSTSVAIPITTNNSNLNLLSSGGTGSTTINTTSTTITTNNGNNNLNTNNSIQNQMSKLITTKVVMPSIDMTNTNSNICSDSPLSGGGGGGGGCSTHLVESILNSNAPGPPNVNSSNVQINSTTPVTSLASLPKILSQITGSKTMIDQSDIINPQKALQTINNALMRQQQQQQTIIDGNSMIINSNSNNLR